MTHVPFSPEDEVHALHLRARHDDNGFDDDPSDGLSAYENDDLDLDLDDDLEDEDPDFPRGDSIADSEARIHCPYCGESVEIALDPGGGSVQRYVEDCEVCCRPWNVAVRYDEEGRADVSVDAMDE